MNTALITPLKKSIVVLSAIGLGAFMLGFGLSESAKPTLESTNGITAKAQVGQAAPDFTLTDLQGNETTLSEYTQDGKIVVLEWFSPMCPFVKKHYREDTMTMINLQGEFADEDIVWLRINSAKASHPSAKLEANQKTADKWGITTPILLDPTGVVGKSYGAKRTPEVYIIDATGTLVYHGAIDNKPDAAQPGDVNYVQNGLGELIAGNSISNATNKAYGCSIKY